MNHHDGGAFALSSSPRTAGGTRRNHGFRDTPLARLCVSALRHAQPRRSWRAGQRRDPRHLGAVRRAGGGDRPGGCAACRGWCLRQRRGLGRLALHLLAKRTQADLRTLSVGDRMGPRASPGSRPAVYTLSRLYAFDRCRSGPPDAVLHHLRNTTRQYLSNAVPFSPAYDLRWKNRVCRDEPGTDAPRSVERREATIPSEAAYSLGLDGARVSTALPAGLGFRRRGFEELSLIADSR